MLRLTVLLTLLLGLAGRAAADEGMWLPMFIDRLDYADLQKKGLKLTPEEIYSVNQSSLKDAIVWFGGFCTAEMVSEQGLLLTNHHCGYDAIRSHSTVEADYLEDGFWAMQRQDELPNEGLTASFLVRMADVTDQVQAELSDEMDEATRRGTIAAVSKQIQDEATADNDYRASVKAFFGGNEFYLFVYETYRDVRLVGAPPSSIGKFGGDTDNWMWPRHTGDFAMFRVYAGADGQPADYAADNVPLKPKHHLPVSLSGVRADDFVMVMGYPGSTDRYLTSYGVELATEETNPTRVKLRREKLDIMQDAMQASSQVKIDYASKYARVSNYWKYFIGQTEGLQRLDVISKKRAQEDAFRKWVAADPQRQEKYGGALSAVQQGYDLKKEVNLSQVYLNEAAFGPEIVGLAYGFQELEPLLGEEADPAGRDGLVESLREAGREHFGSYHAPTDRRIFAAMMRRYYEGVPKDQHPEVFATVVKKYKGDFDRYAKAVFDKSFLADSARYFAFLANPSAKQLGKDLGYQAMSSILGNYIANLGPRLRQARTMLDEGNRLYIAGLREMMPDRAFYPNANSTMRLTYGTVQSYYPRNAVYYDYLTTLEGVMEKADSTDMEFIVPRRLQELYEERDYGPYGEDGQMPVAFISNNDITGGNSGSPVINGRGELVGIAFDGNWEAMSGDIAFEPELQRTISVDIRYVLFIIDKYAGAGHLVKEMTLVRTPEVEEAKAAEEVEAEAVENE